MFSCYLVMAEIINYIMKLTFYKIESAENPNHMMNDIKKYFAIT